MKHYQIFVNNQELIIQLKHLKNIISTLLQNQIIRFIMKNWGKGRVQSMGIIFKLVQFFRAEINNKFCCAKVIKINSL